MAQFRRVAIGFAILAIGLSACGGSPSTTKPPTSTAATSTSSSRPSVTTAPSSTAPAALTAEVTATPDHPFAGEGVTFTVAVRGRGVLSVESVAFGDGGTTGANAGEVPCGQTTGFDVTHNWTYVYKTPGTYQFMDEVGAIGPPPACRSEDAVARTTVVVSAPTPSTLSTGFLSPSRNIACAIEPTAPQPVRCASFSPPQLAMMDATGSVSTCFGDQCELGNPGPGAPVLPYGSVASSGPYQCVSSTSGMTCTVANGTVGTGFEISRAGITRLF